MHAHMWATTDGCSELLWALERVAAWIWPKKTAAFEPGEFEIPSGEPSHAGHHLLRESAYVCFGDAVSRTLTKVFPAGVGVTPPSRTISVAEMSFP